MNILMTGGTGLIGSAFIRHCTQYYPTYRFTVLTRQLRQNTARVSYVREVFDIDPKLNFDAVINLAGEPIAKKRWSSRRKKELLQSRVEFTRQLINHLDQLQIHVPVWINASAVGWYGDQGNSSVTESTAAHDEFTHQLCDAWEQIACSAAHVADRICIIRLGLVIAADGGFLQQLLTPFKLGLGGRLGNGSQFMPWIYIDDVVAIMLRLLKQNSCHGIYNATAPQPVTNKVFSNSLGKVLRRPVLLFVPAWLLKSALGEMSRLLLTGQNATPKRLQEDGFVFKFNTLEDAITAALQK